MAAEATALALDSQGVFRTIVNDSIVIYSTTMWMSNMRQAIRDTNVLLNLAISRSV